MEEKIEVFKIGRYHEDLYGSGVTALVPLSEGVSGMLEMTEGQFAKIEAEIDQYGSSIVSYIKRVKN